MLSATIRAVVVLSLLDMACSSGLAQPAFTLTELGDFGEGVSEAYGLNDHGDVVGQSGDAWGNSHAFFYTQGVMHDLGTMGGTSSTAWAINNAGQIVGWWTDTNNNDHAFLYSGGTRLDLSPLGSSTSRAYGINALGQVVGQASDGTNIWAFLYSQGTMVKVGGDSAIAYGLNDYGQVVGQARGTSGRFPFLDSAGSVSNLVWGEDFPGGMGLAFSINNHGQVVGQVSTSSGGFKAFLYSAGSMVNLDTLGGFSSAAIGLNAYGQAVGWVGFSGGRREAVLFSGGRTTDLNTLIDTNSGWELEEALAINNQAQIACVGVRPPGYRHAFLLSPTAQPPGLTIGSAAGPGNRPIPALTLTGAVGQSFGIECATNPGLLSTWTILTNVTLTQPVQVWPDTNVNLGDGTQPARFYRVVTLP